MSRVLALASLLGMVALYWSLAHRPASGAPNQWHGSASNAPPIDRVPAHYETASFALG